MTMDNLLDIRIFQFILGVEQQTSVLCAEHQPATLDALRELGVEATSIEAPASATCDGCVTEANVKAKA